MPGRQRRGTREEMSLQQALMWFFTAASGAAIFCFALLVQWYWRRERVERNRLRQARLELAELGILFQSIREVISENKRMAAQFSKDMEARVDIVKDILLQSVARTRELYERQKKLADRIVALENRLRDLERGVGNLPLEGAGATPARTGEPASPKWPAADRAPSPGMPGAVALKAPSPPSPSPSHQERLQGTGVVSGKPATPWVPPEIPSSAAEKPRSEEVSDGPLSPKGAFVDLDTSPQAMDSPSGSWQVEDNDKGTVEEDLPQVTREESAEGWDRVRRAFRELLDFAQEDPEGLDALYPGLSRAEGTSSGSPSGQAPDGATDAQRDEDRAFEILKRRVLAYREAGMSEEAIARELGIGRGEVRLMLSLSKLPRHGAS